MKHGSNMSNIEMVQKMLAGERPITQVGYEGDSSKYVKREVGDTWTDSSGKEWIQKESGPQTVTRVIDIVREETNQTCSCCKKEIRWGTKLDAKIHAKTGKCLDCLTEEETRLRILGKYKTYESKKMLENELSHLNDIKKQLVESKEYLKEHKTFTFVNGNGMVETWSNEARTDALKSVKKDFSKCLKEIERVEGELQKVNDELNSALAPT